MFIIIIIMFNYFIKELNKQLIIHIWGGSHHYFSSMQGNIIDWNHN